jgi:hypothetical protein
MTTKNLEFLHLMLLYRAIECRQKELNDHPESSEFGWENVLQILHN